MLKDAAARFAQDKMAPLVKQMDDTGVMDMGIIDGLFEQGVSRCLKMLQPGLLKIGWHR